MIAASVALGFLRRIPAEVYAVIAAVIVMSCAMFWAYGEGKASRDDEVAMLRGNAVQLQEANIAANVLIDRLQAVNAELAEGREADRKAAAAAVANLQAERDRLRRELDKRRRERGYIYANDQNAGAWAAGRVPDAVADSLR